jgi:hypothetical protein
VNQTLVGVLVAMIVPVLTGVVVVMVERATTRVTVDATRAFVVQRPNPIPADRTLTSKERLNEHFKRK